MSQKNKSKKNTNLYNDASSHGSSSPWGGNIFSGSSVSAWPACQISNRPSQEFYNFPSKPNFNVIYLINNSKI